MEDFYFCYEHMKEMCANCKFCEFDVVIVSMPDAKYHGYDGTYFCSKKEDFISATWRACDQMEEATKEDYIKELAKHLVFALSEFPKTNGKTVNEVFSNVLNLYKKTIKLFPPERPIIYEKEFYDPLIEKYKSFNCDTYKETIREIYEAFYKKYYETF